MPEKSGKRFPNVAPIVRDTRAAAREIVNSRRPRPLRGGINREIQSRVRSAVRSRVSRATNKRKRAACNFSAILVSLFLRIGKKYAMNFCAVIYKERAKNHDRTCVICTQEAKKQTGVILESPSNCTLNFGKYPRRREAPVNGL